MPVNSTTNPTLAEVAYQLFMDVAGTIAPDHTADLEAAANDNAFIAGTALHEPLQELMAGFEQRRTESHVLRFNDSFALHTYKIDPSQKNLDALVKHFKTQNGGSGNFEVKKDILTVLMAGEQSTQQIVIDILKSEKTDHYTRKFIIAGFEGTKDTRVIGVLLDLLNKTEIDFQELIALSLQGSSDPRVVSKFLGLFSSKDPKIKLIGALGLQGNQTEEVRETFRQFYNKSRIELIFRFDPEGNNHHLFPDVLANKRTMYTVLNSLARDPQTLTSLKNIWEGNAFGARDWIAALLRRHFTTDEIGTISQSWGSRDILPNLPTSFLSDSEFNSKIDPMTRAFSNNTMQACLHALQAIRDSETPQNLANTMRPFLNYTPIDLIKIAIHTLLVINSPQSIKELVDYQEIASRHRDYPYPHDQLREVITQLDPEVPEHRDLLLYIFAKQSSQFRVLAAQMLERSKDPVVTEKLADFILTYLNDAKQRDRLDFLLIPCIQALKGRLTLPVYEAMVASLEGGIGDTKLYVTILEALDGQLGLKNDAGELFVKKVIMRRFIQLRQYPWVQKKLVQMLVADDPTFSVQHLESISTVRTAAGAILSGGLFDLIKPEASAAIIAEHRLIKNGFDESLAAQLSSFVPQEIRDAGALMTSAFYMMGAQLLSEQPESKTAQYIQNSERHTRDGKLFAGLEILAFGAKQLLTHGYGYTIDDDPTIKVHIKIPSNRGHIHFQTSGPSPIRITYNLSEPERFQMARPGQKVFEVGSFGLNSLMHGATSAVFVQSPLMARAMPMGL